MLLPGDLRAVLFDLDDTLYPQSTFLDGAWDAVARAGATLGLEPTSFRSMLGAVAAQGSDRGRIIDRAVALAGGPPDAVPALVSAFTAHRPATLSPYPGVREALLNLASMVPLAIVTDGQPAQQRAKLTATGLADLFDVVVVTDDDGRELRKPHPHGFRVALDRLRVRPSEAVVIGDRVEKDVAGAATVGSAAIRVRQGEHRRAPTPVGVPETGDTPSAVAMVVARMLADLTTTRPAP